MRYEMLVKTIRIWVYNLVQKYTGDIYLKRTFRKKNGYSLDLDNPKDFQEKVCWKMINDRNPLLPVVADKYLVYYYVASKIGSERASKLLVKNYNLITEVEDLDKIELPNSFIMKSNQGSSRNFICHDKTEVDVRELKKRVHKWLNSYIDMLGPQWAYKRIINKVVMVQKLLKGSEEFPIVEFKLYMLHGKCYLVHLISDRYGEKEKYFLDHNFELLPSTSGIVNDYTRNLIAKHKENILELSYKFSEDFDFIRADFMIHDNNLYLGELTNYPGSIFGNRIPESANREMGKEWKLDRDYWKRRTF